MNNGAKRIALAAVGCAEAELEKAGGMLIRYQLSPDAAGKDLRAAILLNGSVNPVIRLAKMALQEYGIAGINVVDRRDQVFEVVDVELATQSLSALQSAIAAARETPDHDIVADGMNEFFTDVMADVGATIQLPEKRVLRHRM